MPFRCTLYSSPFSLMLRYVLEQIVKVSVQTLHCFIKLKYTRIMYLQSCAKKYRKIENLVFRPKMAIFRRTGMREGGLPLPLAFQYLILMIWRACDLNLVMISSLTSKGQNFKLRGLQFHIIKWLKNGHPNFKDLPFWSKWRYHDQI